MIAHFKLDFGKYVKQVNQMHTRTWEYIQLLDKQ